MNTLQCLQCGAITLDSWLLPDGTRSRGSFFRRDDASIVFTPEVLGAYGDVVDADRVVTCPRCSWSGVVSQLCGFESDRPSVADKPADKRASGSAGGEAYRLVLASIASDLLQRALSTRAARDRQTRRGWTTPEAAMAEVRAYAEASRAVSALLDESLSC